MPQEKEVYTVTQLDNDFFEEYKRLDRLCSDMYSCQDGIRQYLEDMECQFSAGEKVVPNWMRDYRKLRGLRKRRNNLAHNVSEYQVCTERDIEDVKDFINRIMRRQDPLAMLNLYDLRNETPKAPAENEVPDSALPYYDIAIYDAVQRSATRRKKKIGKQKRLILWILLLFVVYASIVFVGLLIAYFE